ncbi:cysteine desulfurase [Blastopirellula sp. JC732]|uniref:cysteine desulfurase n=1 Tax=Blastopirellula sediminis TaxID=2894196 RepID=A0A9X1SE92_9BACT|nr:cysteine desulfurase family protein [Blastopirellula sediminis]MCC9609659.1 cysteine desulfurase [Blastopirellula sediminis]MCC9627565.1 cysteine desulfurase [Blastopirellula sediminis]
MRRIYLDHNTTTPLAPSVQEAMLPFLAEFYATPDYDYPPSRIVEETLEDARGQVAKLIGATNEEIVFTASGTESINLAIQGTFFRNPADIGGHLIVSALDHPAVTESARFLKQLGVDLTYVRCDKNGVVDPEEVEAAIGPQTRLVCVTLANHEIGVIQPLRQIADVCRNHGVLLHADAVQACGKIRVQVQELGVDLLSLSAHKFYGPKGAAALYIRNGTPLAPLIYGEGQERGLRSGHENVAAWIGMGAAAELVRRCLDESAEAQARLRDMLHDRLAAGIPDRLGVPGAKAERLPNTLSVQFPGVNGARLLRQSDSICAYTASSMHTGQAGNSPTLSALNMGDDAAAGTIRFSVGWYTSEEEIEQAADILVSAWSSLVH